jgi:hypothetical protein
LSGAELGEKAPGQIGHVTLPGRAYKVEFFYRSNSAQWAHRKTTVEDAENYFPPTAR